MTIRHSLLAVAAMLACGALLAGCGGASPGPSRAVAGVAAAGAPVAGRAWLKDAAGILLGPAPLDGRGAFSFDVSGLTPPFVLKAEGLVGYQPCTLFSAAPGPGTANINPFSSLALQLATGLAPDRVFGPDGSRPATDAIGGGALGAAVAGIGSWMRPLLERYGVADFDPIGGPYVATPDCPLDAMLDVVLLGMDGRSVFLNSLLDGSPIASGATDNLARIPLVLANAPDASALADVREITRWLATLCSVMNLGQSLTAADLDPLFVADPAYGTSGGRSRAEDIDGILAIFGPGGAEHPVRLSAIRSVRLSGDLTAAYADRPVDRSYLLDYDFILDNGAVVRGNKVTLARETSGGPWKFIGDPTGTSGGNNNGYVSEWAVIHPTDPEPPTPAEPGPY